MSNIEVSLGTLTTGTKLDLAGLMQGTNAGKVILRQFVKDADGNTVKTTLDITPLKAAVKDAEGAVKTGAKNMSSSIKGVGTAVKEAESAVKNSAKNMGGSIRGVASDVKKAESQVRISTQTMARSFGQVGDRATAAGAVILAALAGAVKVGADYEQTLLHVSANTNMTQEQAAKMRDTVEQLGAVSGVSLNSLAEGYMHVSNFGFEAADATQILDVATKAAVATGADASKTAELLAGTLKNFGLTAGDSARTMDMLRDAAAKGNVTLEQFVRAVGPAAAVAHTHGVALSEVDTVMVTLTQHQYNAAQAATHIRGALQQIAEPSKAARINIAALDDSTHSLAKAFSEKGLRDNGLVGVLDAVNAAALRLKVLPSDLIQKLVPGGRGRDALAVILQNYGDFTKTLEHQAAIETGKVVPAHWQDVEASKSLAVQTEIVRNNMTLLSADIEQTLLPAASGLLTNVKDLVTWFRNLPPDVKSSAIEMAAFAGGGLLTIGVLAKAAQAVLVLQKAFVALTGIEALAGAGALTALAPLLPYALAAAAAAAAAYGLYRAWEALTNEGRDVHEMSLQEYQQAQKTAQQHADNAREVKNLVDHYEMLRAQGHRTDAQNEDMRATLQKIAGMNAGLISGFDAQGNALDTIASAAKRAADALRDEARAATLASAQTIAKQNGDLADKRAQLEEERKALAAELQKGPHMETHYVSSGGMGMPGAVQTPFNMEAAARRVAEITAEQKNITGQMAANRTQMTSVLRTGPGARERSNEGVTFRHPEDVPHIEQKLLDIARQVAQEQHVKIDIGTAITGHPKYVSGTNNQVQSRHGYGGALDMNYITDAQGNRHKSDVSDPQGAAMTRKFLQRFRELGGDTIFGVDLPRGGNHFTHAHLQMHKGGGPGNAIGGDPGDPGASGGGNGNVQAKLDAAAADAKAVKKAAAEERRRLKAEAAQAKRDAREEARDKENQEKANIDAGDELKNLQSKTELETKYREAKKEFFENIDKGVNPKLATQILQARADAAKKEFDAQKRQAEEEHALNLQNLDDERAKIGMDEFESRRLDALREQQKTLRELDKQQADGRKGGVDIDTSKEKIAAANLYAARVKQIDKEEYESGQESWRKLGAGLKAAYDKAQEIKQKNAEEDKRDAAEALKDQDNRNKAQVTAAANALELAKLKPDNGQAIQRAQEEYETQRDVYRNSLELQLGDYEKYSADYTRIAEEIAQIDIQKAQESEERAKNDFQKKNALLLDVLQQTRGILANSFEELLTGHFNKFFASILQGFEKMLITMVAQWLAKMAIIGIVNAFTGGVGGHAAKSRIFGFLGFDSGNNDRDALRWGRDWYGAFGKGVAQQQNTQAVLANGGSRRSGNSMNINSPLVSIGSAHIHNDTDIRTLSATIADGVTHSLQGFRT